MAAEKTLVDLVTSFFESELHLTVPSVDTDLFECGALDSMAFVQLLLYVEKNFGIEVSIDDLELENFRTIDLIARFIMRQTDNRVFEMMSSKS
jgi:methoxymalonate biosynthesis acyl carrier protein